MHSADKSPTSAEQGSPTINISIPSTQFLEALPEQGSSGSTPANDLRHNGVLSLG